MEKHIDFTAFRPDIEVFDTSYRDLFFSFHAGSGFENFDDFLLGEEEFDIKLCGIPALEIKMFAVDERYQDRFLTFEGESLPVSVWILRLIITKAMELSEQCIGFKALFLHSVEDAESFYLRNGFRRIEEQMEPLHSIDSDFQALYLPLHEIIMCNGDETIHI